MWGISTALKVTTQFCRLSLPFPSVYLFPLFLEVRIGEIYNPMIRFCVRKGTVYERHPIPRDTLKDTSLARTIFHINYKVSHMWIMWWLYHLLLGKKSYWIEEAADSFLVHLWSLINDALTLSSLSLPSESSSSWVCKKELIKFSLLACCSFAASEKTTLFLPIGPFKKGAFYISTQRGEICGAV